MVVTVPYIFRAVNVDFEFGVDGYIPTCVAACHGRACGEELRAMFMIDGRGERDASLQRTISRRAQIAINTINSRSGVIYAVGSSSVMSNNEFPKMRPMTASVHYACRLTHDEVVTTSSGPRMRPRMELQTPTHGLILLPDTNDTNIAAGMSWDIATNLRGLVGKIPDA